VNKENKRFSCAERPENPHEKSSHGGNFTDWFVMSSHGSIDPLFFNETVNSDRYFHTLQNDCLPQLRAKDLHQQTQQYMQDGTSTDTGNVTLDLLNTILILYLPCIVQKTTFKTEFTCTGIYNITYE